MHTTNCFEALDSYCVSLIHIKASHLVGNYGYTKSDKDDIEQILVTCSAINYETVAGDVVVYAILGCEAKATRWHCHDPETGQIIP